MAITDPLVLPPDVLLVPVAELTEEIKAKLSWEEGDYAITRPRSRTPSRIVDAGAADLLSLFREPVTIVEAVIRFSRERSLDPETTLEEAYPLLERLLASGFLVAEGSDAAGAIEQSLQPGEEIAGFEVLECIQGMEDTELYQVRGIGGGGREGTAALKIERPQAAGRNANDMAREAAVLEHLGGERAPRLLARGEVAGRHWIAIEWCPGVDGYAASLELRRREDRAGLLALARSILDAYARLHDRGVIHGDVHPRNVLVSPFGEARLLDFGIARWEGSPEIPRAWRGGVAFYFEPEYAVPVRAGLPAAEASAAGEQYAIGSLLYFLLTGAHYRDFSLEKDTMLRQIAEEPPLPFAERGVAPWPEVEAILARALAKAPEDRFPSVAAMAEAFATVETPPAPAPRKPAPELEALLGRVLDKLRPDGDLFRDGFPEAPRLSINYGAAGAAFLLYRIAQAKDDAELLSRADLWAVKAVAGGSPDEGFYNPARQLDKGTLGPVSPYHSPSGPRAVQALVAHALGDLGTQRRAAAGFLEAVSQPCANPDLTLGRSGVLLAAAMLLDTLKDEELGKRLRALGDGLLRDLWAEIDEQPPVLHAEAEWANLGMAHGWAGYLYATLRWCRSAGTARPERLEERLAQLAGCGRSAGRGLRWPWRDKGGGLPAHMPGWCNGSAGFVHLWTLAARELDDPSWMAWAEGAAWNAWEAMDRNASLCCGLAGRAYALLDFWKHGGGEVWLQRARELAELAAVEIARFSEAADSLYKGEPGVASLVADLAKPEAAAQPFFGDEGWREGI